MDTFKRALIKANLDEQEASEYCSLFIKQGFTSTQRLSMANEEDLNRMGIVKAFDMRAILSAISEVTKTTTNNNNSNSNEDVLVALPLASESSSMTLSEKVSKALAERDYETLIRLSNLDEFDSNMSIQLMESMSEFIEKFKSDATNIMLGEKSACETVMRLMNRYIETREVVKSAARLVVLLARKNHKRFVDCNALILFIKVANQMENDDVLLVDACSRALEELTSLEVVSETARTVGVLDATGFRCNKEAEQKQFNEQIFPSVYRDWLSKQWQVVAKQCSTNKEAFYPVLLRTQKSVSTMVYMGVPDMYEFVDSLVKPIDPFTTYLLCCWDDRKNNADMLLKSCEAAWSTDWKYIDLFLRESVVVVLVKAIEEESDISKAVVKVGLNYLARCRWIDDYKDIHLRVANLCRDAWKKWKSDEEIVTLTFLVQYAWQIFGPPQYADIYDTKLLYLKIKEFHDCEHVIQVLQLASSWPVEKIRYTDTRRVVCDAVRLFAESNAQFRQRLIECGAAELVSELKFDDEELKRKTLRLVDPKSRKSCVHQ